MTTTLLSTPSHTNNHKQRNRVWSVSMFLLCLLFGTNGFAQDGSLDLSFDPGTGINAYINEMILQPDGKILICGNFTVYQSETRKSLARVNTDGTVDLSFDPGVGPDNPDGEEIVYDMALQPDGKIVIVGNFQSYGGVSINKVARLNADGTLDTSFDPGASVDTGKDPHGVAVQPDGKILIGGNFSEFDGTSRERIARLNADGSLDMSFDPGSGVGNSTNSSVGKIHLQSDGKPVIIGDFSSYNAVPRNNIARLNTDGSLDTSFASGAGPGGDIFALSLRADGKMMIVGNFSTYDGTPQKLVARLNADGGLDTTFVSATTFSGYLMDVVIQPDDKVVVVGSMLSYNGDSSKNVMRILADGSSLDPAFSVGAGANAVATDACLQTDGKILVAGEFFQFDGVARDRMARIIGSAANSVYPQIAENKRLVVFPTVSRDQIHVEVSEPSLNDRLEVYNSVGVLMYRQSIIHQPVSIDVLNFPVGAYFVHLKSNRDNTAVVKFVRQ